MPAAANETTVSTAAATRTILAKRPLENMLDNDNSRVSGLPTVITASVFEATR